MSRLGEVRNSPGGTGVGGTGTARSAAVPSIAAEALHRLLDGQVLVPADDRYDAARRVWNGEVHRRPAVIARCASERDVSVAVQVARDHGLELSVKAGGHDWGGRAVVDGGLMVDLSGMREVTLDPATGIADVQGGTRAGDLAVAAHRHDLVPVTGTVNQVGLGGLTLGGGYGLLLGRFGLSADNLVGARVVLADGRRVTADADQDPELFWALRGGGGNFGVVTGLRYAVHPMRTVRSGMILFPSAQAVDVLRGYRELIDQAPDELTVMAGFFGVPDERPLLFLLPLWCGEPAGGDRVLRRLERLGRPVSSQAGPMAYRDVLNLFDDVVVDGRHNEAGSRWLPGLSDDVIDVLVAAVERMTSPYSGVFLHHFHGAASRVATEDTAFALRSDHLLVEIVASQGPSPANLGAGALDAGDGPWARALSQELSGHALPGGYPNLLGPAENDRALRGYGLNLARLLEVKRRFDPDGVFHAIPELTVVPT